MDRSSYGGPPQSTIGSSARRIQAQLPAEPPACVQNAMMRRDKQPFTYTPGGIDLSQIKSPRMAKRISRNANSEGVTGQPKVSPLAQNNGNGASNGSHNPVSPAATLGAAAMGMPFQVFPTGPPAPPPPPPPTQGRVVQPNGNRSMPPPPPPPGPIESRKSPKPQVFEPPPMGMRPEIKIPVNPLANLRKAPRPQPKNDYWIEEYRREKQQEGGNGGGGGGGGGSSIPRPVPPSYSYPGRDLDDEASPPWMSSRHNSLKEQPEWVHRDDPVAGDEAGRERRRSQSPPSTPPESEQTEPQSQQQQQQTQTVQTAQTTRESGTKSVDSIATASLPVGTGARPSPASYQLTQQTAPAAPAPGSANAARPSVDVSAPQPYAQQQLRGQGQQQPQQQQPNRVGPAVGVSPVTVTMPVARPYQQPHGPPQGPQGYSQAQPVYSPQPPTTAGPQKERIIPIQIEKSPVQSPATAPSFAPPPYYSPSATYGPGSANGSSMQSPVPLGFATPHSGFTTPTAMFTNPNHFVNQGYNNISYPPTPTGQPIQPIYQAAHPHYPPPLPPTQHYPMHAQQQRMQQQQQQQQQQQCVSNVRIVPIKVEATAAEHTARGPLANTPAIIQSDPRSSNNAQAWNGNNAPNQSRSFRVLQQITDTLEESGESVNNGSKEPGSQPQPAAGDQTDAKPAYGGRAGARTPTGGQQQQDLGDGQLRRLQLSNEDKALMNRVKNQVDGEVYLHNEEDPRYRGAAIPSKAFRYLQNMTDMSGQAANQSTTGSGNRAQQMFIPSRPSCNESDGENQQSQPYVPPSEQTVEEPKKYTGGSIPSRSFKMLQAMTDAPGPGETDF